MNSSFSFQNVCGTNFFYFQIRSALDEKPVFVADLHVIEDHGRVRVILFYIIVATERASQTSTTTERAVLQRRRPVRTAPNRRPPKIPSECPQPVNQKTQPRDGNVFSRALIPVRRDPLQVEVDHGPQDVCDPRAIVLFRLDQPLRIFEKDVDTEGRAVCPNAQTSRDALESTNITYPRQGSRCEPWDREVC